MKALVIEDDQDVRDVVCTLLESKGWEVVQGEDGEEALLKAVRELPDIIIMGVMMPRKSGLEALQELRTDPRTCHLSVIMLTAVNDQELSLRRDAMSIAQELGVAPPEAFLEKPLKNDVLLATITDITGYEF